MYLLSGNLDINRWYIISGVTILSILPDFDYFILGPHRTFSHSLLFCMLGTAVVGRFTSFSYLTTFLILLSHLLLDSFADGFNTVSWLFPFYIHPSEVSFDIKNIGSLIKQCLKVF